MCINRLETVSYTHLDVYKRQTLYCVVWTGGPYPPVYLKAIYAVPVIEFNDTEEVNQAFVVATVAGNTVQFAEEGSLPTPA